MDLVCLDWAEFDYQDGVQDKDFLERRVKDAKNYCRSPDSDTQPWCFVHEEDEDETEIYSKEYCDVPACRGIF